MSYRRGSDILPCPKARKEDRLGGWSDVSLLHTEIQIRIKSSKTTVHKQVANLEKDVGRVIRDLVMLADYAV